MLHRFYGFVLPILFLAAGCSRGVDEGGAPVAAEAGVHAEGEETPSEKPTNRINVPENVRRNLGIRFAKVESRRVADTLRMPGRFETQPLSRREYSTPLPGRVELLVNQYDSVTTGQPLYELDSVEWRRAQQEVAEAIARVESTSASVVMAMASSGQASRASLVSSGRAEAGERHLVALRESVRVAEAWAVELQKLGRAVGGMSGEMVDARTRVADTRAALVAAEEEKADSERERLQLSTGGDGAFATTATQGAALQARVSDHKAAHLRLVLARAAMRSVLQVSDEALDEPDADGLPMWQTLVKVKVRATAAGVVETLPVTHGAHLEASAPVLTTIDPEAVRFRAVAYQSDLGKLRNGMVARIAPPSGGSIAGAETIAATLVMGLETDAQKRSMDVIVTPHSPAPWARAGVTAYAEAVLDETSDPEPAVPVSAVVQDELDTIVFRRDPENPDKVIRLEADIGVSDGEWIAMQSGLAEGDEVVVEGAYTLKLVGTGKVPQGAHVDADGTVHFGKH